MRSWSVNIALRNSQPFAKHVFADPGYGDGMTINPEQQPDENQQMAIWPEELGAVLLHFVPVSNPNRLQYLPASHHLLRTEDIMAKVDSTARKNEEFVAATDHTEKIKSQVLAKIGRPPRLHHVEVSRHHNGNYRVNIWEQPEPIEGFVVINARIRSSYYLKVSDTGEIIRSNPPLIHLGFPI